MIDWYRRYDELQLKQSASAERRARNLFMSHLTKTQAKTLKRVRWIEVRGNHTGHVYRIDCRDETLNIRDRNTGRKYCAVLAQEEPGIFGLRQDWDIPRYDHLLAQKLAIEANEKKFLRIACRVG